MKQAIRSLWTGCALVALAFGCREEALTQIVVVVDSDWDGFARIEIEIDGFERRHTVNAESRNGRLMLPRRVALVHEGGPLGPISVTARGYVTGRDEPVLTEPRKKVLFERDQTRMLKIDLLFGCIGQCRQACLAGPTCVDSDDERATALTPWDGDVDGIDVVYRVGRGDVIDGGVVPMPGEDGGVGEGGAEPADAGDAGDGTIVTLDADATSPPDVFTYTPTNFDPGAADIREVERTDVVLDCGGVATFDSSSREFGQWCGAEPEAVTITQLGGTSAVVLVMETLTIAEGSTLELRGDQPVILAVFDRATIDGVVDASGRASANGPGAGRDCDDGAGNAGPGATSSTGAGGGSGGGFGSAGGQGGQGGDAADGTPAASAVSGGDVNGSAELQPLRGGCPGGLGGDGASGGGGGGAVQISVARSLVINGTINAAGGGGAAGVTARDGGGGGGSGGAIVLEAATLETGAATVITANGGAGGAGQPSTASTSGAGEDGQPTTVAASGGAPPSTAGGGGDGSVLVVPAEPGEGGGTGSFYGYGAGGGGGGVGRVRIRGADSCTPPGVLSPAPSVECAECGTCASAPGPDCLAFVHGGRSYYNCTAALDWDEARVVCEAANLNLVRIDDAAENAAVVNAIAEDSWIGASDVDGEDEWRWTDGTEFWSGAADGEAVGGRFSAWYDEQPDNAYGLLTNADCGAILLDTTWGDRSCLISHPYVCEE
jgi:hypothetical protein